MGKYIVVAYYTENTDYADEVTHLIASLKKFQLPMDIVGIPHQGSWLANTQYKAYFIKQMLIRHYPKDILYLDADARVQKYPELFDNIDFDIGAMYLNNEEMLGGTLYFANNAKVSAIVEKWVAVSLEHPQMWDKTILQHIIQVEAAKLGIIVRMLPTSYSHIFDWKGLEEPVIEHFQANRRFKKKINELGKTDQDVKP